MPISIRRQHIPWLMAATRAALGPLLVAGERCGWNGLTLAAIVLTALLSDIFDGVLARRWHCDTPAVRLFDSLADTVFYLCTAAALCIGLPAVIHGNAALLAALLAIEALRYGVDFAKFGKAASYHSWLAKAWGLVLASAVIALFVAQRDNPLFPASLLLGLACNVEGLAMSLILPAWRHDVKTLRAAWRLRCALQPARPTRGSAVTGTITAP